MTNSVPPKQAVPNGLLSEALRYFAVAEQLQALTPSPEHAALVRALRPVREHLVHGAPLDLDNLDPVLLEVLSALLEVEQTSLGAAAARAARAQADPMAVAGALARNAAVARVARRKALVAEAELVAEHGDVDVARARLETIRAELAEPEMAKQRASASLWRRFRAANRILVERQERAVKTELAALEERIAAEVERGRHAEVLRELRRLVDDHPYRGRLASLLMLALCRSGRPIEASVAYRRYRRYATEELGIDPGPEVCELHQRMLANDLALRQSPAVTKALEPDHVWGSSLPADPDAASRDRDVLAAATGLGDALLTRRSEPVSGAARGLASLEFGVLGPVQLLVDGCPAELGRPRVRALFALLVVDANQVVSFDRIVEGLWGDEPPEAARTVVRDHVSRLRRILAKAGGAASIRRRPPGYVLEVDPELVDLHRAKRMIGDAAGRPAVERAELLGRALDLWRGSMCAGAELYNGLPEIDQLRLAAVEERIAADLELGRHTEVIGELHRLVDDYPFRERLLGLLMLALYRSGRRLEALVSYRHYQRFAAEEFLDPNPELRRLHELALRDDPALRLPMAQDQDVAQQRRYSAGEHWIEDDAPESTPVVTVVSEAPLMSLADDMADKGP